MADDAVGGAGMLDDESAGFRSLPWGSGFNRLLGLPLVSRSATWLEAEAAGEEVTSMASGADAVDADMVMASAGIGTTRVPIDPSGSLCRRLVLSVSEEAQS